MYIIENKQIKKHTSKNVRLLINLLFVLVLNENIKITDTRLSTRAEN